MTGSTAKTYLTAIEAARKWGELLHPASGTYRHFEEGDGEWRPELHDGELAGYRWAKRHKTGKTHWRRR
jgi:hypothetical protein